MIRPILTLLLALFALTGTAVTAAAQSPKPLLKDPSGAWAAYQLREKKGSACYMTSKPVTTAPKGVRRGEIWFLVTHRPKRKVTNEISIYMGYPLKPGNDVTVIVDKSESFKLFIDGEIAWGDTEAQEKSLVKAMRKGNRMVVTGLSTRGTKTSDQYSLKGFTRAYRAISKTCGVK